MMDFMGLMKQAQQMQAKMAEAQLELENIEVEGEAGGGLVRVTLSAKGAMKSIFIDESLVKPQEKEILEDLILTAHMQARNKADEVMAEKMKAMTGGLQLPPGFKLPF
ncbi:MULTISPECIES: YbaB/EbfC family nucleoid-associated protein [Methylocystis]|uniref:YbaB/EbfC family nucleoid-associated protein n=1 Tax=Methylocystis TaxID=133 RepID=UPI0019220539|nr:MULTISPECIES: YbaB/EbfC family nucleoid-associated protein [Methylocystis]MBL1257528.1 YbaB/EbfC family nucleoid-associated protein [Methylocystis sp. Sn-Cys]